ncbi:MAG: hypothetical protein WCL27_02665 [Betaproteobacteria bacterium]
MGAQENLVLESMEDITLGGCHQSPEQSATESRMEQDEPKHKPTGLMSIFTGCEDVW